MERAEEEVPRLVAREDPAGAIPAVRRGGEPDDQEPRPRITERGKGTAPVDLSPKTAGSAPRGFLPPGDEPRTAPAGDDPGFETAENGDGIGQRREYVPVSVAFSRTWPRIAWRRSSRVEPASSPNVASSAWSVNT